MANAESFFRLASKAGVHPAGPRLCSQSSWVFLTCFCYLLLRQVSDGFCLLCVVVFFFNLFLTRVSSISTAMKGKHWILLCSITRPVITQDVWSPLHNTCSDTRPKPRGFSCFSETFVYIAFWPQKDREDCKWVFKSKLGLSLLLMNFLLDIFTLMLSPRGPMSLNESRYVTVCLISQEFVFFLHAVAFYWHTLSF